MDRKKKSSILIRRALKTFIEEMEAKLGGSELSGTVCGLMKGFKFNAMETEPTGTTVARGSAGSSFPTLRYSSSSPSPSSTLFYGEVHLVVSVFYLTVFSTVRFRLTFKSYLLLLMLGYAVLKPENRCLASYSLDALRIRHRSIRLSAPPRLTTVIFILPSFDLLKPGDVPCVGVIADEVFVFEVAAGIV